MTTVPFPSVWLQKVEIPPKIPLHSRGAEFRLEKGVRMNFSSCLNYRAEAEMGCVISEPLAMPEDEKRGGGRELKVTNRVFMRF